jgi:hypothetical protein
LNLRNAAVLLILMLDQDVFLEPRSARRPEVAQRAVELESLVKVAHVVLQIVSAGCRVRAPITWKPYALDAKRSAY